MLVRRFCAVAVACPVLVGCGESAEPDPSTADGIAAYACALAADALSGTPPGDWNWAALPGGDVNDEIVMSMAIVGLNGVRTATPLENYAAMHDRATGIYAGLYSGDSALVEQSLTSIGSGCDSLDAGFPDYDTSTRGRAEFACLLVREAASADEPFALVGPDPTEMAVGPHLSLNQIYGAIDMLGVTVGAPDDQHPEVAQSAQLLAVSLLSPSVSQSSTAMDQLVDACLAL